MKKLIFLLLTTFSFAQSVTKTINLLPDTGQNTSYTATVGEDNDYNINVPSYTDNGNGTITDNVTGLMWQKVDGGEMTFENAISYCDNLVFAGYSDWRLPTPLESFSIMNLQNSNPALNTTYFSSPTTPGADYWWTSTVQYGDATKVWCTNAGGGIGNKPKAETMSAGGTLKYNARAVRTVTTPTTITNHFTDNGDGTITDNLSQLVWQKIPNANLVTWEEAITYAEGLTLANALDWRLPNIKELQSITNELTTNPSVFAPYFSNLGVHNYWSSTTLKPNTQNPSSAWYWSTQYGITAYGSKTSTNYVLCVRGIPQLGISQFENKNVLKVFPNPFSTKISFENKTGNEFYELYDIQGKRFFSGKNIDKQDFSNLTKGTYFLKVIDHTISNFKLIKE